MEKVQRFLTQKKKIWERLLKQNLSRISNDEDSEFIPLSMRITDKQDESEFCTEDMINHIHTRPVALVGSPGVGKSTLLLKFAIHLADCFNLSEPLIPVFISAGPMANYRNSQSQDILSWIHLSISANDLETLMCDGKLCIIVDGVNESSEIKVDDLLRDIYGLYDRFPFCKYVISCRSLEFPRKWGEQFDQFAVNPVTEDQIRDKFKSELASTINVDSFFVGFANSNGGLLLNLCRNPLLLTLVVRIVKNELIKDPNYSLQNLRNKGDIYKRFCEILNDYRARKPDYDSQKRISAAVEKDFLSNIAYYMQCTKSVYIHWGEDDSELKTHSVESLIRTMPFDDDSLKNYVNVEKEKNGEYAWYKHVSSELKKSPYFRMNRLEYGKTQHDQASFIHQSFGEYFAGIYICDHKDNKNTLYYLLSSAFDQRKNWNTIEFATCLDESFVLIEEILDYATSFKQADALLLAARCLVLNSNRVSTYYSFFNDLVDDCCIWLLDAFKNWAIAYNYELIYEAKHLLPYVSETFPERLKEDIRYFSEKYSGDYDAIRLPEFFDRDRLTKIASNNNAPDEYRANAVYTLGLREWDRENALQVRDYLFELLSSTKDAIKEQVVKAIKSLLEVSHRKESQLSLTAEMQQILLTIIRNKQESGRIRTYALNIIAETGDANAINILMEYLCDRDNPYRDSASWSLQNLVLRFPEKTDQMVDFYLKCLINESNDLTGKYSKGNLVYTLSKIGSPKLVPKLKKWLSQETSPYVIEDGIGAIGMLAEAEDLNYLKQYFVNNDPVIRAKAAMAVFRIAGADGFLQDEIKAIKKDKYSIVRKAICPPDNDLGDDRLSAIQIDELLNLSTCLRQNSDERMQNGGNSKMAEFKGTVHIGTFVEMNGEKANLYLGQNAQFLPDNFAEALRTIRNDASVSEREYIDQAINSAETKNENAFIQALKKVAEFGGNILAKVSSEVFIAYLRAKGIM